jgi:hypothetical protein
MFGESFLPYVLFAVHDKESRTWKVRESAGLCIVESFHSKEEAVKFITDFEKVRKEKENGIQDR